MLAGTRGTRQRQTRRGVILILVLGMLALMAVIGVTFATFSGQARIGARNVVQSVIRPQRDELMDFALAQLISDTADVRSAIRGHSMSRDMYGNDAQFNGYLTGRPGGMGPSPFNYVQFYVTNVALVAGTTYDLTTNIPQNDPALYGYNFARWTLRLSYNGTLTAPGNGKVDQTLEVLVDNGYNGGSATPRVFRVNISPTDAATTLLNPTPDPPNFPTGHATQLPGQYLVQAASNGTNLGTTTPFILDGRWLHAFNGTGMGANAVHGNFRYNGASPGGSGMDEDYDAADLENWFLALQSADGNVIIPSFHRPAAIRRQYDATGNAIIDDWKRAADTSVMTTWNWADSAARIMRPVAADGHDAATFRDLTPDPASGKITFDVDNDGDGHNDSVWVDLGYPARRNAQGQLFKPLFAFMVVGLNGRIPLNTAGNMAGGRSDGSRHSAHLGNSVSEIDPSYGLQNWFDRSSADPLNAFVPPVFDPMSNTINYAGANSQVDSGNVDVRLTQLRNLLAGTRPQLNPQPTGSQTLSGGLLTSLAFPMVTDPAGATNGDDNFVAYNNGQIYFMPNGIAEAVPIDAPVSTSPLLVQRLTQPIPGRWGEAQTVHGYPISTPGGPVNLVTGPQYGNSVRPGYSVNPGDLYNGRSRDAADDNYNSFDPAPSPPGVARQGEVNDADFYDPVGALVMPVERMRRFLTPVDINGTGRILQWNNSTYGGSLDAFDLGGDRWGRVVHYSYFRPPGLPGQVSPTTGEIAFQWTASPPNPPNYPADIVQPNATGNNSHNNNPLRGFESFRFPNLNYPAPTDPPAFSPQRVGGTPIDGPPFTTPPTTPYPIAPTTLPTYDVAVNSNLHSDGVNEADELNLYQPNPQIDSPFGYPDLEWLYRKQDVDGGSLTSRLSQLAPISFTNTGDGQRRRRLYSLESWEPINFVWSGDNPSQVNQLVPPGGFNNPFATNSRFVTGDASFSRVGAAPGVPAPSLVQRDRKLNLNYPLPVSNDPNEPVRQKWISDAYQMLKVILPPRAVDTPEELAQLSQYVINIVDFRDTDCTMTHWTNPDVQMAVWNSGAAPLQPVLIAAGGTVPPNMVAVPLDQYGMELSPIAINEVLAYSFLRRGGSPAGPQATPRFFMELVNTLTSPETGTATNNASILDLSGLLSNPSTPPAAGSGTSWSNACWDIIFTADDVASRPDPYLGQLQYRGTFYGLVPLTQEGMTNTTDVTANPLPQNHGTTGADYFGMNYFLTIGNPLVDTGAEQSPIAPSFGIKDTYDPFRLTATPPMTTAPVGVLPLVPGQPTAQPQPYPGPLPSTVPLSTGTAQFYWVCLRRPANPFAPVSAANPMIVVDSMRFPYIESKGVATTDGMGDHVNPPKRNYPLDSINTLYSYQRFQPYRGGHAVPAASGAGIDTRYGYTEQIAQPLTLSATYGKYDGGTQASDSSGPQITNNIYHTIGFPNDGAYLTPTTTPQQQEYWDWVPFHDRDFSNVAELMLVPGCPPGMFTKRFAEFAPSQANVTSIFVPAATTPLTTPTLSFTGLTAFTYFSNFFNYSQTTNPLIPHTFPYLVDKFFYSAPSPIAATAGYGDSSGDGWFKMFEFFEVPSQMAGAIGPVAQGVNLDWARQDAKPGLINLNLIIDEEVFFSVFGKQNNSFNQQLLNFDQLPLVIDSSGNIWNGGPWNGPGTLPTGASPLPLVVSEVNSVGSPTYVFPMPNVGVVAPDPVQGGVVDNRMKSSFAQFLSLRHGGSGFVFGFGNAAIGQNFALPTGNPNAPGTPNGIPAERPFRSLSFPDVNMTVMRPAALPPSTYTDPQVTTTPPTALPPTYPGNIATNPGVRNTSLYPAFATTAAPVSTSTAVLLPPAIPTRRLFQVPDISTASNASQYGDAYLNNLRPATATSSTGALPTFHYPAPGGTPIAVTAGPVNLLQAGVPAGAAVTLGSGSGTNPDNRQQPYFRSELMQKAMNLTTVRTHQYAVWITVGFFEVTKQGDLGMLAYDPRFAFDTLGPEIGASTGQATRHRSFFVVDRLQLHGFDPNTPGSFRPAVMYRQEIE